MVQLELPLVYSGANELANPLKYQLPLRWKAVFVLLLMYSILISAVVYGKVTSTHAETAPVKTVKVEKPEETAPTLVGTGQVKMTATVPGWYDVIEMDNANLLLKTNMKVWVNGREFIRCDDCDQQSMDTSLLDF